MAAGQDAVLRRAIYRSSGPFSSGDLARMDHPFATRHGSPRLDPSTINVQSGAFRADWQGSMTTAFGVIRIAIVNDNPVADFLKEGTPTMFARPIEDALEREAEPLIETAIEAELARMLGENYS